MKMYPELDLYQEYKKRLITNEYSSLLPDVTKKITLEHMNFALNLCDKWEHCMDIGGGTGHYLAPLANKFKKATLVEVETHPEQQVLEKISNVTVFHGYIEKYTPGEKVDFILLADVYEHIPDIKTFVSQLSSMQDIGGVVYIMTPNPIICGPAPESGIYYTRNPNGHIKQYVRSEIEDLMNSAGYQLVLKMYEETPLRQQTKRILFGLSRRDKNWSKYFMFRVIRPFYLTLCYFIFSILEKITHRSELNNRTNEFNTMTQDLVFKKMNK